MSKHSVLDFIRWALTHAKRCDALQGATLPLPLAECGTEPWHYLYGSVRVKTTPSTLDYYYKNHYNKQMTRPQYDAYTSSWSSNGYATDCQGLLDAYLTYEQGERTDINADMNYKSWCTDKGRLGEINRPFVIGEALFMANASGRMNHVGWVCGFDAAGEPLVVEARGIAYGVVVTKLAARNWTHRGLMTVKFDYTEAASTGGANDNAGDGKGGDESSAHAGPLSFEITSPIGSGEAFRAMQRALNLSCYTDDSGQPLAEDGKWGKRSRQAFEKLLEANAAPVKREPPLAAFCSVCGEYALELRRARQA